MDVGFTMPEPPSAALAAHTTSVVSAEKTFVASRAKTSVAAAEKTPDISMKSTTPLGAPLAPPQGVVDEIEMSGVFSVTRLDKNIDPLGQIVDVGLTVNRWPHY